MPSDDLLLRVAERADAAAIAAIYAPFVRDTAISFEAEAPTAAEMEERIATTLPTLPWLVCEDAAEIVGYAYAATHRARAAYRWSVDVSVYLAASHHRRGIGSGLYRELLAVLARQGFYNVYAGITLPNPASVALHESVGFRPLCVYRGVGHKHGAWHDVGWWEMVLRSDRDLPREPEPFAAVRPPASWRQRLDSNEPSP